MTAGYALKLPNGPNNGKRPRETRTGKKNTQADSHGQEMNIVMEWNVYQSLGGGKLNTYAPWHFHRLWVQWIREKSSAYKLAAGWQRLKLLPLINTVLSSWYWNTRNTRNTSKFKRDEILYFIYSESDYFGKICVDTFITHSQLTPIRF